MGLQEVWREAFAPDSGTLLDIRVYGTSDDDYRTLLSFLNSRVAAQYVREGVEGGIPEYETILKDYENVSAFVRIDIGVQINLWFHCVDEMNLDLLPDDIDSLTKAERVVNFMRDVSMLLKKRVLLTAENASADQEWSEKHCIISVNPTSESVVYHPELGDWSHY